MALPPTVCRPLLALILILGAAAPGAAPEVLHYPALPARIHPIMAYVVATMTAALDPQAYRLEPSPATMHQGRAIEELRRSGGDVQLIWTMTSAEREEALLPIRIPIDKGLFGWRISLVRGATPDLLAGIGDRAGLARLTAGQGFDWPDTGILRANGIPVETSPQYELLFAMLTGGRFDHFPRAALEATEEVAAYGQDGALAIDPHLLLHYPTALYFFVGRQRQDLADALARGLERMVADGTLDRLFRQHLHPGLAALKLRGRRVIELDNPLIRPGQLPLERRELWFRPEDAP